jgi:hypothetical protein
MCLVSGGTESWLGLVVGFHVVGVSVIAVGVNDVDVVDLVSDIGGVAGDIGAGDFYCVGMMPPGMP